MLEWHHQYSLEWLVFEPVTMKDRSGNCRIKYTVYRMRHALRPNTSSSGVFVLVLLIPGHAPAAYKAAIFSAATMRWKSRSRPGYDGA